MLVSLVSNSLSSNASLSDLPASVGPGSHVHLLPHGNKLG